MTDLDQQLRSGLDTLGQRLSDGQIAQLLRFIDELAEWNQAYNLTALRDPDEMVTRHLLDSLSIAPWLRGDRIVDVGSGAGLPGLVLAIAEPERRFTLIDSIGKKVRFMRHAIRSLGLTNVEVNQARVERLQLEFAPSTITARAFAPIDRLLTLVAPICSQGTRILAMRGRAEPVDLPAGFKQLENRTLKVPRSTAVRHLLIVERE